MNQKERRLIHERQQLLKEMTRLSLLLRGSYFERFSTCVRPQCECHRGKKHGPRAYLVLSRDSKQRQTYVPQAQQEAVRRGLDQYRKLEVLVQAVTDINVQLMQAGVLESSGTRLKEGDLSHE